MRKSVNTGLLGIALSVLAHTAAAQVAIPTTTGFHQLANTRLRPVCAAENGFPQVHGNVGCRGITYAWNSGAFDSRRNRVIIFGGGHNDYYGNEIYAVNVASSTVQRLTDPGLPPASSCTEAIAGGAQPNSRHTYDGMEYMPNIDRLFIFGGSLACNAGNFGADTWTFDFATMRWQRMNPSGAQPQAGPGALTAYDPATGRVFLHDRHYLYSYDFATNSYTRHTNSDVSIGYHMSAVIDPVRKKFVMVGWSSTDGAGRVYMYDITPGGSYAFSQVSTTGGGGVVESYYPGLAFDPNTNLITVWSENQTSRVYTLDLGTRQWSYTTHTGGPVPAGNGVNGRWQYSAASGVFVLVNRVDDNVVVFRPGASPPADTTAPGQVQGVRLQ
jgi:hypothetical protein